MYILHADVGGRWRGWRRRSRRWREVNWWRNWCQCTLLL